MPDWLLITIMALAAHAGFVRFRPLPTGGPGTRWDVPLREAAIPPEVRRQHTPDGSAPPLNPVRETQSESPDLPNNSSSTFGACRVPPAAAPDRGWTATTSPVSRCRSCARSAFSSRRIPGCTLARSRAAALTAFIAGVSAGPRCAVTNRSRDRAVGAASVHPGHAAVRLGRLLRRGKHASAMGAVMGGRS